MWRALLLLGFLSVQGLQICGNYCGPNWCNGKVLPEASCDGSIPPDPDVFKTDSCCRDHDMCCGHGDRSLCNDQLIKCITADNPLTTYEGLWDEYVCGTATTSAITIAYFFDSLGVLAHALADERMCCSELCALPGTTGYKPLIN
jgi:hypothetical protein